MTHSDTDKEQIETRPNLGRKLRGPGKKSRDLLEAMRPIIEAAQPITIRGVGYKLFVRKLIASMNKPDISRVSRRLKLAREQGLIPWEWIVDETRHLEKTATWNDPDAFIQSLNRNYRREFWNQQPVRCEVWSEKGTVRGVLAPVLDKYGVGFRALHGFASATVAHDVAEDYDGRDLVLLYVGDYDPSGMFMSQADLPARFAKYDGGHVKLKRIALTREQTSGLLSFPAADKRTDVRYKWFVEHHGNECWELDAMDPNDLRSCVEAAIKELIEPIAWARCEVVNHAEKRSISEFLGRWNAPDPYAWTDMRWRQERQPRRPRP